jgi:hypothetical protein
MEETTMRTALITLAFLLLLPVIAEAQDAAPLPFADKRHVGFFDKDYSRYSADFQTIDAAKKAEYELMLTKLENRLTPISKANQSHPEVEKRRGMIAAWRAKVEGGAAPAAPDSGPAPAGGETDEHIEKAKARLDDVEKALAAMAPGDRSTAGKLLKQVGYANQDLGPSTKRDSAAWKGQLQRGRDLVVKIKEKGSAPPGPAAPPPSTEPATPVPAGAELQFMDKRALGRFDKEYGRKMGFLQKETPESFKADDYARASKSMAGILGQVSVQNHPEVLARRKQLEAFEALFEKHRAAAPAGGELQYQEKRNLQRFDKEFKRIMGYLDKETAESFKPDRYVGKDAWFADVLAGVANQNHPEVVSRREQIKTLNALLAEKGGAAAATLSGDDQRRIVRIGGELAARVKALAAHKGTVLDSGGERGPFHGSAGRYRTLFSSITKPDHADAKKLAEGMTAFEAEVAKRTAQSKEKAAALGDVRARTAAIMSEFGADSFPPSLSRSADEAGVKAFAQAVKTWQPKVEESVAYVKEALLWGTAHRGDSDGDKDLGNKLRRFVGATPGAFQEQVTAAESMGKNEVESGLAFDPASISVSRLRDYHLRSAQDRLEGDGTIAKAIQWAKTRAVYTEAMTGKPDPTFAETLATLEAKPKEGRRRAKEQLESERFPKPDSGAAQDPELLKIAHELSTNLLRVQIATGKTTKREQRVEEDGTETVIVTWDYDYFIADVASRAEESGQSFVYRTTYRYYRSGRRTTKVGEWIQDSAPLYRILEENVGK